MYFHHREGKALFVTATVLTIREFPLSLYRLKPLVRYMHLEILTAENAALRRRLSIKGTYQGGVDHHWHWLIVHSYSLSSFWLVELVFSFGTTFIE